ncbi:MAG: sugar kinase [Cetobacterium sp.]|uniref:sugar kinase n=1 Tax=Cetobacterium sp. TaxID=2071632 RepID=UPI002FC7931A
MEEIFNFGDKKYDIITSGEIIMRLSSINGEMLVQGSLLEKQIGGSEYNIAVGAKSLGLNSSIITKLPTNELGRYARKMIRSNGVSQEFIVDDNSSSQRLALYYFESGSYPRKPNVVYDRNNSSFFSLNINELKDELYNSTKIFHTSGISLGLCENSNILSKELIKKFKENNTLISFDVNFRANLWDEETAKESIEEILPYIDILFISEETLRKMFKKSGELENIIKEFSKTYNIGLIASTRRVVNSPKSHNFTSIIYSAKHDEFYTETPYENIEILDRIGSGDAYVSGVLYGLLEHNSAKEAVKYGNANSVLKNTIIGDTTCADLKIVKSIIAGHECGSYGSELNR